MESMVDSTFYLEGAVMKRLLNMGRLFLIFIGLASTATADTFTTSSGNVDFSVNDGGSFYVESSQILPGASSPPGQNASSYIVGSNFHLTIGGGDMPMPQLFFTLMVDLNWVIYRAYPSSEMAFKP